MDTTIIQDPQKSLHRLGMSPAKPSDSEWTRRYHAHLNSPLWEMKRQQVIARQECICAGCGYEPVEHIHHLTYAHMGDELLFELVGLCIDCHRKCHSDQHFK